MCRGIPKLVKEGRKLSETLHDDISIFYSCRRHIFTVEALLHNTKFFCIVKSNMISVTHTGRIVAFVFQHLFTRKSQNITLCAKFLFCCLGFSV